MDVAKTDGATSHTHWHAIEQRPCPEHGKFIYGNRPGHCLPAVVEQCDEEYAKKSAVCFIILCVYMDDVETNKLNSASRPVTPLVNGLINASVFLEDTACNHFSSGKTSKNVWHGFI